jgi:Peptidase S24-like
MNKFERLKNELEVNGNGKMTCFGNRIGGSVMLPILKSGSTLTFIKTENFEKGDIVFCKVKGRYIDAHKITKIDPNRGFLIANNHGFENGWTKIIYGKAIKSEFKGVETLHCNV